MSQILLLPYSFAPCYRNSFPESRVRPAYVFCAAYAVNFSPFVENGYILVKDSLSAWGRVLSYFTLLDLNQNCGSRTKLWANGSYWFSYLMTTNPCAPCLDHISKAQVV